MRSILIVILNIPCDFFGQIFCVGVGDLELDVTEIYHTVFFRNIYHIGDTNSWLYSKLAFFQDPLGAFRL